MVLFGPYGILEEPSEEEVRRRMQAIEEEGYVALLRPEIRDRLMAYGESSGSGVEGCGWMAYGQGAGDSAGGDGGDVAEAAEGLV